MPDDAQPADEPLDSATDWVAEHTRRYVETDGEDGHLWQGLPCLVLTTLGRRSGRRRRNALIYGQDGEAYVVVGSNGGSDRNPLWYGNLTAEPSVTVQVGADVWAGRARDATDEERARYWPMMNGIWSYYASLQEKTERTFPIVVLERA